MRRELMAGIGVMSLLLGGAIFGKKANEQGRKDQKEGKFIRKEVHKKELLRVLVALQLLFEVGFYQMCNSGYAQFEANQAGLCGLFSARRFFIAISFANRHELAAPGPCRHREYQRARP